MCPSSVIGATIIFTCCSCICISSALKTLRIFYSNHVAYRCIVRISTTRRGGHPIMYLRLPLLSTALTAAATASAAASAATAATTATAIHVTHYTIMKDYLSPS